MSSPFVWFHHNGKEPEITKAFLSSLLGFLPAEGPGGLTMLATGAGAESRQSIGSAVFFGTVFSLALTLLVVPTLYLLIARNTRSPHYVSGLIDRLTATLSTTSAADKLLNVKE